MKIGLLSDTHDYLDNRIFEYFDECQEIWHAGDIGSVQIIRELENFKPLRAVYGNIDDQEVRAVTDESLEFEAEGVKVLITHIGGYPSHYANGIKKKLLRINPGLFICGHSHILRIMHDKTFKNLLYINPGAAGLQGFHKMRTIVRFTLEKKQIFDVQVIELGKR